MHFSTVIWDFNGTIVNDVELGMQSVNRMLSRRKLPLLMNREQYHAVFCFPVREYYRRIGFDFEAESYETLAEEWVNHYTAGEKMLKENDGFSAVSDLLKEAGLRQIILSSSETEMLHRQLEILRLSDRFDAVLGLDNIYAGGKVEMARRCLGELCKTSVLIGDTPHDAETARAIGAECILYAGGHSSRAALEACGFPVIDHLCEIPGLIF